MFVHTHVSDLSLESAAGLPGDDNNVVPRQVGEVLKSTVGVVATALNYPMGKTQVSLPNSTFSSQETQRDFKHA